MTTLLAIVVAVVAGVITQGVAAGLALTRQQRGLRAERAIDALADLYAAAHRGRTVSGQRIAAAAAQDTDRVARLDDEATQILDAINAARARVAMVCPAVVVDLLADAESGDGFFISSPQSRLEMAEVVKHLRREIGSSERRRWYLVRRSPAAATDKLAILLYGPDDAPTTTPEPS